MNNPLPERATRIGNLFGDALDKIMGVPASSGGRAGRPTDQARAGLGDTATIPNAQRKLTIEWRGK